jgi:hypothetical protein
MYTANAKRSGFFYTIFYIGNAGTVCTLGKKQIFYRVPLILIFDITDELFNYFSMLFFLPVAEKKQ